MARLLRCSFCGRRQDEVARIVAGPHRVGICDECIQVAREVALPSSEPATGDLVLTGIGEAVTNDRRRPGLLGLVEGAAVAIRQGKVAWVGAESDLPSRYRQLPELACDGRAVLPGFVDPHTHLVFAGERSGEFAARLAGASYLDIQRHGGGIAATVAATRLAEVGDLVTTAVDRAGAMLEHGTTTVEIKSGYGLEPATELAILEVARQVGEILPLDVVITFLGAHQVAPEFVDNREGYLDLIEREMLPAAARTATYCDVFCDKGAFSVYEARRVLEAGLRFGLKSRLHANQLGDTGGVDLAAALGVVSADHLEHVNQRQARALAEAGVVAVLCPTASWAMRAPQAPGPMLWDAGVQVALATDCNPGTSYVASMQLVIAVACLDMGLRLEEAVWSATRGGAIALEEPDKGVISPGAVADLVVLDVDSYRQLAYRPDLNLVRTVIKQGDPVVGSFASRGDTA
ncbi:MAG TPA: imidazolonepropionase [Acidimicrobiia bacterium]|nr:imidazolonepropionase [Acidimicrobiia bacterium]